MGWSIAGRWYCMGMGMGVQCNRWAGARYDARTVVCVHTACLYPAVRTYKCSGCSWWQRALDRRVLGACNTAQCNARRYGRTSGGRKRWRRAHASESASAANSRAYGRVQSCGRVATAPPRWMSPEEATYLPTTMTWLRMHVPIFSLATGWLAGCLRFLPAGNGWMDEETDERTNVHAHAHARHTCCELACLRVTSGPSTMTDMTDVHDEAAAVAKRDEAARNDEVTARARATTA
ncbi:uncharacterized protein K452DRAFT_46639 [Aplosporella prunicola CBS 121167]|uniref:Uncharacterized protein n=1 Tax=Aplosporella prunicola CBS 121167 TaxID=1176127 RepID=A0A6A6BAQ6_9PEZI|nr:uncharacterized protein K452DRAFT_46639 [Aplosporella prunicola CBS 121167]KAF2140443.1 hypothetical protein K452DRAFT_46639 [Aplosporella prunicola CBS 121167]